MKALVGFANCAFLAALLGCSKGKPATPPVPPIPDGYLRVPLSSRDLNLDPAATWNVENSGVFHALFDSLYWIGADGKVEPNLAAALPEVSDNGLRYRISLREGARFHDDACFPSGSGRKVVAEDVLYTLKRIAHPSNASGFFSILRGRIVGLDEYRRGIESGTVAAGTAVDGLRAVDDRTAEIHLCGPLPQFAMILGISNLGIVPREAVEQYGEKFGSHPVGTGPFQLESYRSDQILLRAAPDHPRFSGLPSRKIIRGIAFRLSSSQDEEWQGFRSGFFHLLPLARKRIFGYVDSSLKLKPALRDLGFRLATFPSPYVRFMMFNYRTPALREIGVRRAVALAVPWRELVRAEESLSTSIVPRGITGYRSESFPHDVARAKEELARAGHANGQGLPELRVRVDSRNNLARAVIVVDALEAMGIRARIDYGNTIMEGADLSLQGWVMDYPDAENVLSIFDSRNPPPNGYNHGWHQYAKFDALLDRMSNTGGDERVRVIEEAVAYFHDQVVAIPYGQADDFVAVGPEVEGVAFDWVGSIQWSRIAFRREAP